MHYPRVPHLAALTLLLAAGCGGSGGAGDSNAAGSESSTDGTSAGSATSGVDAGSQGATGNNSASGTTSPTGAEQGCVPLAAPQLQGVFVTADGSPGAAGTQDDPIDLVTALSDAGPVGPGDTVWVAEGTYVGDLESNLSGTAAEPIDVRAHPGARVIVDTGVDGGWVINGAWTNYTGFEVLSSAGDRVSLEDTSGPTDIALGNGVTVFGANVKIVNFEVHDTSQGFSVWTPALDAELYGNIIYNNGWTAPGRGHGHAIYTQNLKGTKRLIDNIIFFGFGTGVHAYTENGSIQGFDVEDNVWFHTGASDPRASQRKDNCLIGGFQPVARVVLRNNLGWSLGRGTRLGYGGDVNNLDVTFEDNFLVESLWLWGNWDQVNMSGNTFFGSLQNVEPADYPGNEFAEAPKSGQRVFVRANTYDAGRARVAIYNWDAADAVNVDLSGVLQDGEAYEVRSVFDLHGEALVAGEYDGQPVAIPMGTVAPPQPTGLPDGVSGDDDPGKLFGTFLVRHLGCQ